MSFVHFHSNEEGLRPNMVHSATRHAEGRAGHVTVGVSSVEMLKRALRGMLGGEPLEGADFHTHGSGGSIGLGVDRLNHNTLLELRDQGFEAVFAPGATIEFLGCNVAETAFGELFIADMGSILLRGGGGRCTGSTSVGFQDPLYTGAIAHFWGEWVTAEVRPGGGVSLRNHRHLHPQLLRREIERIQDWISGQSVDQGPLGNHGQGLSTLQRGVPPNYEISLLSATSHAATASQLLRRREGGPSYRQIAGAYEHVRLAWESIRTYSVLRR